MRASRRGLKPADIDAIAARVAELLREATPADTRLLPASEVAERFGLSRAYVYEHADDLGAIRVGSGSRPRLRFDADLVAKRLTSRQAGIESESRESRAIPLPEPNRSRRRRRKRVHAPNLIPIRPPRSG